MSDARHEDSPVTRALRTRVDIDDARPAVTPLFQASAYEAGSSYFYQRMSHPNCAEWEQAVGELEGVRHGVGFASGMAAIAAVASLLERGDKVVLDRRMYGCSFRLFDRLSRRLGLELELVDLVTAESLPSAKLVFFETPTNPFLATIDINRTAALARQAAPDVLVAVDSTWATPLFQSPVKCGADLSLHSATKFLAGHSDVMGGLVLTEREDLADSLRAERFYSGAVLDPHAAWLLRRSLQTLELRLLRHVATTTRLASFLGTRREVLRVDLPVVDGAQLRAYGGILFFELAPPYEHAYERFRDGLRLFGTGTGMAAVTSMVAQPWSGSHASLTEAERRALGLSPAYVRLCFGLENPDDLERDLQRAFDGLEPH